MVSEPKTNVFISWSGDLSQKVAKRLSRWIEDMLHFVDTWISSGNLEKGTMWFEDLQKTLNKTSIGILCVTPRNINSPWLLFEAGALSKGISKNRVCPVLIDIEPKDVPPPISFFNLCRISKDDFHQLIGTINKQLSENELEESRLNRAFDKWWPDVEADINKLISDHENDTNDISRSQEDMIGEVLDSVRGLRNDIRERVPLSYWVAGAANDVKTAFQVADRWGFPIDIRPSGYGSRETAYNLEELEKIVERDLKRSPESLVLIESPYDSKFGYIDDK